MAKIVISGEDIPGLGPKGKIVVGDADVVLVKEIFQLINDTKPDYQQIKIGL